ncbi:MAG: hypothetical protein A2Z25_24120 [Planctomycetes bacterium RBG_16_55_9]|nr:MAG: hypothetical protein A2Z25_24120 [Planctomycetes bacterium RBG_16_55_9]
MREQQIRVGFNPPVRVGGFRLSVPFGRVHRISLLLVIWIVLGSGCAHVRVTDPSRTATEQFLLSEAASKATGQLSFQAVQGRKAFLDVDHFAPVEKEFLMGEFRAQLLHAGVSISPKREEADIIVEVRSGGVGIDRYESLFGIPAITAPSGAASAAAGAPVVSLITPEIAITKKIRQIAFASVSYVAYWADTGEVVASSGPAIGKTYREDWWFFGFGPRTIGNIPPVDHKLE